MSVPSNEVWVNDPIIPVPQGIYEVVNTVVTGTQNAPLGTRLRMSDRSYYYAQASASVAGGTVVCCLEPTGSHQSGLMAMAAASIGAKVLSGTSSAAVAVNYYAEGFFGVASGTNIGELYRIKGNAAGSTGFGITLYDGLNTAITSGTAFFLIPNLFGNVFIGSQNLDFAVGVAPVNVTSGGFFWLQTWGVGNPTHQSATPAGAALRLGTTGSVLAAFDATTNAGIAATSYVIGKNQYLAATAAQANPVFLSILP